MQLDTDLALADADERRALLQAVWRVGRESQALAERELTEACYYAVEAVMALDREAIRRASPMTEDEYVTYLARQLQNEFTLHLRLQPADPGRARARRRRAHVRTARARGSLRLVVGTERPRHGQIG